MYRVYATDPQMRLNLGIRRRLAPLLGNDRRRDGADERTAASRCPGRRSSITATRSAWATTSILGDRDGVRTPMQWSRLATRDSRPPTRQRLRLPVVIGPELQLRERQRRGPAGGPALDPVVAEAAHRAAEADARCSGAETSSRCSRRTARCWRTSASTTGNGCSSWPTCRASSSTSNWTCRRSPAPCPSRCSAGTSSRPPARPGIHSRSDRTPSIGSSSCRPRSRPLEAPGGRSPSRSPARSTRYSAVPRSRSRSMPSAAGSAPAAGSARRPAGCAASIWPMRSRSPSTWASRRSLRSCRLTSRTATPTSTPSRSRWPTPRRQNDWRRSHPTRSSAAWATTASCTTRSPMRASRVRCSGCSTARCPSAAPRAGWRPSGRAPTAACGATRATNCR